MSHAKNPNRNSENTNNALAESDCHEMSDNEHTAEDDYQELPAVKDNFADESDYQEMSSYRMY